MPSGTSVRFSWSAVILGLCIVFSCCDFRWRRSTWSQREELLTSSRHSGLRAPPGLLAFGCLSIVALNFASILASIWACFWKKNHWFVKDLLHWFRSIVFCKIMKVLTWFACTSDVLKSRFYCSETAMFTDLHAFSKLLFWWTVLCICPWFWCQLFTYFRILFEYIFVHRFFTLFWSKNDVQNRPKMTPKSTQVRPRAESGFLALSGHLWTYHFYDFWCQNGS